MAFVENDGQGGAGLGLESLNNVSRLWAIGSVSSYLAPGPG